MRLKDLPPELVERMVGPVPPEDFDGNGCSCSPDWIGPIDLRTACHWHDHAYSVGGSEDDRLLADRRFYDNLRACGLGRFLSWIYFNRVRLWGVRHFRYFAGEKPEGFRARVGLVLSRYVSW